MVIADNPERMYIERCERARESIFGDAGLVEVRRGFVDSTRGLVLTSNAALQDARTHAAERSAKEKKAAERVA